MGITAADLPSPPALFLTTYWDPIYFVVFFSLFFFLFLIDSH